MTESMRIGWIDFSNDDRQKALDVMRLLQEKGAVDELGIGIVRDAFANFFFPGTSTVQTRAKYFLIVPYLLTEAAGGKFGWDPGIVLRRIDTEERECGRKLLEHDPGAEGIIGSRVLPYGWVARRPSEIYWNGIGTFGIFREGELSLREYIALALRLNDRKDSARRSGNRGSAREDKDAEEAERDDKDAGDVNGFVFWDLPTYHEKWREDLSIDLTAEEAAYLRGRILDSVPGSLLAFVLRNDVDMSLYGNFEQLTEGLSGAVPADMREMMRLACDFNYLIYMGRVRYNVLLSEGQNAEANAEWAWLSEDVKRYASADIDRIFGRLGLYHFGTKAFLFALQGAFLSGDIKEADRIIKQREISLKRNRAKLLRTKEFDPENWVGGGWLDYRMSNARRIVEDIRHGEVSAHV